MLGIYIHIPFCIRRCPFCDFTLVTDAPTPLIDSYVRALCKEIESKKNPTPITSIYLGGGTPSILSIEHLQSIFETLKNHFDTPPDIEITMETNPEDVTIDRAHAWRRLDVNRISLGVQTMNDGELARLGRNHTQQQVIDAVQILRECGFDNISVDLMFGLENQTLESWKSSLQKIIGLKPQHISTYNLTIEKNTKYDQEFSTGKLRLPSDEIQSQMLIEEKSILESAGFDPYEISNSAIPGFESRHNMLYWTGKPYLGFGVSAHSFENVGDIYKRYSNTKNIPLYIKNIEGGKATIDMEEILPPYTHLTERLMTGLRLKKGIDLCKLENEGLKIPDRMKKQLQGLVEQKMILQNGNIIRIPTEKIPITNEILLKLFE
ncbi:MAG: radical SAM family heme chaperone HemW [Bdellovibrionota bacterium]